MIFILNSLGISWPIVDNLLFHYASHHNVLEKVVMYESELAAQEMRSKLKSKEGIIESLARELEDIRKAGGGKDSRRDSSSSSSHVKDDIQGKRRSMRLPTKLTPISEILGLERGSTSNSHVEDSIQGNNDASKILSTILVFHIMS